MRTVEEAIGWSTVDVLARNGLGFVVFIILARLLAPEEFGLIAMLVIFTSIATALIDSGFGQALIQRRDSSQLDESSIFYFNLAAGGLVALVLCLLAPSIAGFYGIARLEGILYWMALNLVIGATTSIQTALFTKSLNFKPIAMASLVSTLVGGGISIVMALNGMGVWALVGQIVAGTVATSITLWALSQWRPGAMFSFRSIRSYLHFGGYIALSSLMHVVSRNIYGMAIGKAYSAHLAGIYTQAQRLQQLPIFILSSIVSRVAFPAFSANSDLQKLAAGFSSAIAAITLVSVPVAILISVLAEPIVLLLLGERWFQVIPVLQVLALAAILMPLQMLNVDVLKAMGHADLSFRLVIIKFVVSMLFLLAAIPHGLVTVAWAFVAGNVINLFINTYWTRQFLSLGAIAQIKAILPALVSGVMMGASSWLVYHQLLNGGPIAFLVSLVVGLAVYVLAMKLLFAEHVGRLLLLLTKRDRPTN